MRFHVLIPACSLSLSFMRREARVSSVKLGQGFRFGEHFYAKVTMQLAISPQNLYLSFHFASSGANERKSRKKCFSKSTEMIVTADINLRKVVCPCTRVGTSRSKCFLSLRLFENVGYTSQFSSRFPLVIYESFTFTKDFEEVSSRLELTDTLAREPVIVTLFQAAEPEHGGPSGSDVVFEEPETSLEEVMGGERKPAGKRLAQFSGNALDFLFPKPTLRPPKTGAKDFALRPVLLASSQFTSAFKVEPELLFCTHVVVRESDDADIEHNLRPSKEQLISRLIMAQVDQRSSGIPPTLENLNPCSMRESMERSVFDMRGQRKRIAKRIQTVKKKCYMCELRRCYLADMDKVFVGQDVLPPPPGMTNGPEEMNGHVYDNGNHEWPKDCDPNMDFEIHDTPPQSPSLPRGLRGDGTQ